MREQGLFVIYVGEVLQMVNGFKFKVIFDEVFDSIYIYKILLALDIFQIMKFCLKYSISASFVGIWQCYALLNYMHHNQVLSKSR